MIVVDVLKVAVVVEVTKLLL